MSAENELYVVKLPRGVACFIRSTDRWECIDEVLDVVETLEELRRNWETETGCRYNTEAGVYFEGIGTPSYRIWAELPELFGKLRQTSPARLRFYRTEAYVEFWSRYNLLPGD